MQKLNFTSDRRFWDEVESVYNLDPLRLSETRENFEDYLYKKFSRVVREITETTRFNKEQKKQVSEQLREIVRKFVTVRRLRETRKPFSRWWLEVIAKEGLAKRKRELDQKRTKILNRTKHASRRIFVENYRQPQSSWAGGKTTVDFVLSKEPDQSVGSYKVWSDNGKWSGSNLGGQIALAPDWWEEVYEAGIANCEGLLTTHATKIKRCLWSATWLEQSRGMNVKLVSGFIYKSKGFYFHGESEEKCKAIAKRMMANREALKARVEAEKANKDKLFEQTSFAKYGNLRVDRRISKLVGNCDSGTESWLNLHGFEDCKTVSVKELYLADPENERVLAVIDYAIARAKKKELVGV